MNFDKEELFRIVIFSSNDPYFLEKRPGYFICKNSTGSHFILAEPEIQKFSSEEICGNKSSIFIPKSKKDFVQIMNTVDTINLSRPIRYEVSIIHISVSRYSRTVQRADLDTDSSESFIFLGFQTSGQRLWTDYERINQTHFWSRIVNDWWNNKNNSQFMSFDDEYTVFASNVTSDGYKKLRNTKSGQAGASCICVGLCSFNI